MGSRCILIHQKDFAKDVDEKINMFDGIVDPNKPILPEHHRCYQILFEDLKITTQTFH